MNKYLLTNLNIDIISDGIGAFLDKCNVDSKDTMRIKLAVEETLLHYQEEFGEEQKVFIDCRKRFGRSRIEIRIPATWFNPMELDEDEDEEHSSVLQSILVNMGFAPTYQYKGGNNIIVFSPKQKRPSQMAMLGYSVSAAVICSGLSMLLPETLRIALSTRFVGPILDTFMGLLAAIAGPLIFLSVAWSIYSIGDVATLGTIGKRMMSRILMMTFVVVILGVAAIMPFFPLS
ncbi:MAG: hypothetical protein IIU79_03345, partial [Phascolarctobacterium sp.]|nr:hypothetical protein [Phascolarctobacterium sp.]